MTILHGIPNCDTVKKARNWLTEHGHPYRFHDFRKDGIQPEHVTRWQATLGDRLINRKGTTWRSLDAAAQAAAAEPTGAQALVLAQPALIRRPLVEWPDGSITVGFDAADWAGRVV